MVRLNRILGLDLKFFGDYKLQPAFGRARSSAGEHTLHTGGVVGSIPTAPTKDDGNVSPSLSINRRDLSSAWTLTPFSPRAAVRSARLREVASYLDSKRRADGLIHRGDLDPVIETPRNVCLLMLLEQLAGRVGQVRLIGTRAVEILGRDFAGKWVEEFRPKPGAEWPANGLDQVFASDAMFFGRVRLPWDAHAQVEVEWLAQRLVNSPESSAFFEPRLRTEARPLAVIAFDQHDSITAGYV